MDENSYSVYEALKALTAEGRKQEKALEWLYRFQIPAFKRYLMFKGLSQSQAEDVTQIVIIKVFEHADEFRGNEDLSEASAKSWMWKIVRTSLIDFVRRQQKHKREITGLNIDSDLSDLDEIALAEQEDPEADNTPKTDVFEQLATHSSIEKSRLPETNSEFYLQENQTKEQFEIEKQERKRQIYIEDCVRRGIEEFSANEPDRADALLMQIEGAPIKRIAKFIKRTEGATKEYLSQTRKKIGPYVSTCFDLLDHDFELPELN